eukprot:4104893-Karenia_brevis.AAC.1
MHTCAVSSMGSLCSRRARPAELPPPEVPKSRPAQFIWHCPQCYACQIIFSSPVARPGYNIIVRCPCGHHQRIDAPTDDSDSDY